MKRRSKPDPGRIVELTRAPQFEAELIVARLRAAGIEAFAGADSVYGSITFADGVPVLVKAADAKRAGAVLTGSAEPS